MAEIQIPSTQKAAQYDPRDNSFHVNQIPVPSITNPHQLLVRLYTASLCHSDLMLLEPNEQGLSLNEEKPVTIGHEAIGEILQLGSNATDFSVGDVVCRLPLWLPSNTNSIPERLDSYAL
jgi:D-arabinose 1-dehydrogenase-like Zn-dependent alcohol dehydrogenase